MAKLMGLRIAMIAAAGACLYLGIGPADAQYISERNDETYLILALKKQKARFDAAKSEYTAALELKKRNLIANREFERIKASYVNEEITYQQAMLRVIFDQPHILIEQAVKYQGEDGRKRVRLTLRNTTGGVADYEKLVEADADVFDASLQPDKINNVFISLHESTQSGGVGPIISQPYEGKIKTIRFGGTAEMDFLLLKDVVLEDPVRVIGVRLRFLSDLLRVDPGEEVMSRHREEEEGYEGNDYKSYVDPV